MQYETTICAFSLGIAALLLNAGLDAQVLPLFYLILPLALKLFNDNITKKESKFSNKNKKRS